MLKIDINCDLGEGAGQDEAIMPFISSANIACGFHAGDEETMKQTIESCLKHKVCIGAHPSFYDKKNFGRTEMKLTADQIYDLVILQLRAIECITKSFGTKLTHVKPHGALYNISARHADTASAIARAVKEFDDGLLLYGQSNSISILEAKAMGLKTASEVFADRSYQNDGSLTLRSQPNALIDDTSSAVEQALQMVKEKTVTTVAGKKISIEADTICIHGDGKHAAEFAKAIHEAFMKNNILIQGLK